MSASGGVALAIGAGVVAAVWLGTRERKATIAKLAEDDSGAVTYLHAYAAQWTGLAKVYGTHATRDRTPRTPGAPMFDIWQWWVDEVNRITGLDGESLGILGDYNRKATIHTPARIIPGLSLTKGALVSPEYARACVEAYNRFQANVTLPPLATDGHGELEASSAVRFWHELAALAQVLNTMNVAPDVDHASALWRDFVRGAKTIPPALAGFFGDAFGALADVTGSALAAFALGLLSSPVVWVLLAVAAWFYRDEIKELFS